MARAQPASASPGRLSARLPLLKLRLRSAHLSSGTALRLRPSPRGVRAALRSQSAARSPPGTPAPTPAPPGARPLGLAAPPKRARAPAACTPLVPSGSESGCGPGPGSARRGPPPAQPRQLPAPPPRLGGARLREQKADAAGAARRDLRSNSDPLEGQAGPGSRGSGSPLFGSAAAFSPAGRRKPSGRGTPAPCFWAGVAWTAGWGIPGRRPGGPQQAGDSIHAHPAPLAPRPVPSVRGLRPPHPAPQEPGFPSYRCENRRLRGRKRCHHGQPQGRAGTQTSQLPGLPVPSDADTAEPRTRSRPCMPRPSVMPGLPHVQLGTVDMQEILRRYQSNECSGRAWP